MLPARARAVCALPRIGCLHSAVTPSHSLAFDSNREAFAKLHLAVDVPARLAHGSSVRGLDVWERPEQALGMRLSGLRCTRHVDVDVRLEWACSSAGRARDDVVVPVGGLALVGHRDLHVPEGSAYGVSRDAARRKRPTAAMPTIFAEWAGSNGVYGVTRLERPS